MMVVGWWWWWWWERRERITKAVVGWRNVTKGRKGANESVGIREK